MTTLDYTDDQMRQALKSASGHAVEALARASADQWLLPTPCDEWNLTQLVEHIVQGDRYAASVLKGTSAEEAAAAIGDVGTDPNQFVALARASAAALHGSMTGSLDRLVEHPVGTVTARRFLAFRLIDVLGHAWDVNTTLGEPSDFDPLAVDVALACAEADRELLARSVNFAVELDVSLAGHTAIDQFLLLIGRRP